MNSTVNIEGLFSSFTGNQGTKVISDDAFYYLEKITQLANLIIALVGVLTNIINIRVFVQQGVKNSNTNIGLLSLSVFDLLSCFLTIAPFSCHLFMYSNHLYEYLTCRTHANYATFLYIIFSYCSNWTTVYISLERTLCVVIPLKVKLFLRPKVTVFVIVVIFIFFSTIQLLYTTATSIVWKFNPFFNLTLPQAYESPFAKKYLFIYSTLANTVLNSLAIFIVAVNTTIMVYKLNQFKKWRNQNKSNSSHSTSGPVTSPIAKDDKTSSQSSSKVKDKSSMSSKDVELVKSVTTVTCIFLVCLSVSHIPATAILVLPGVSITGINRNLMILAYTIRIGFGLLNSSINFFFYLRVSSRYKEAFDAVFPICSGGGKKALS